MVGVKKNVFEEAVRAVNTDDTFKTSGSKGMWELGGEEGWQGKELGSA